MNTSTQSHTRHWQTTHAHTHTDSHTHIPLITFYGCCHPHSKPSNVTLLPLASASLCNPPLGENMTMQIHCVYKHRSVLSNCKRSSLSLPLTADLIGKHQSLPLYIKMPPQNTSMWENTGVSWKKMSFPVDATSGKYTSPMFLTNDIRWRIWCTSQLRIIVWFMCRMWWLVSLLMWHCLCGSMGRWQWSISIAALRFVSLLLTF